MVSKVMCLLLGHDWFPTVVTHASYSVFGEFPNNDYYSLGLFHEHICLRCGKQEAVHQHTLADWDPYDGHFYQELPPDWVDAEPKHFGYPGDWIS